MVFIHGNLASKDWIELAAPLFPSGLRVIGVDWRGCGESDRCHTDHNGDRNHSSLGHDSDGDDAHHDCHRADPVGPPKGRPKGLAGRMPLPDKGGVIRDESAFEQRS